MADEDSKNVEMQKFEREMDYREQNLDAARNLLKEGPALIAELTNEVVIPLFRNLQPQQRTQRTQQQVWQPPKGPGDYRGEPDYEPSDPQNQDIPGPLSVNNEKDNSD